MRKVLFHKKRIMPKKLRSQRGASVIFALVSFMFAAMISFVVVNAAYSAAARVRNLKYDEQSFLLAQSMTGIITEALAGSGAVAQLPDGSQLNSPSGTLKYDALTVSYQYIEQKETSLTGTTSVRFYNASENGSSFVKSTTKGASKKTFTYFKGKALTAGTAAASVQTMIFDMAKRIDQGLADADGNVKAMETLRITYKNPDSEDEYMVTTEFTMDKSYSINAVTTAVVTPKSGAGNSTYIVRMDAGAAVRTDKLICTGTKDSTGNTISATFSDKIADTAGEELVKVSCYSVTWPPEQVRSVYVTAPSSVIH